MLSNATVMPTIPVVDLDRARRVSAVSQWL
jgi:hypothetical protein